MAAVAEEEEEAEAVEAAEVEEPRMDKPPMLTPTNRLQRITHQT